VCVCVCVCDASSTSPFEAAGRLSLEQTSCNWRQIEGHDFYCMLAPKYQVFKQRQCKSLSFTHTKEQTKLQFLIF